MKPSVRSPILKPRSELPGVVIKKKSTVPETRVMRPFDCESLVERVIRLAWADRITFEQIEEETGLNEAAVIEMMQRNQSPSTFRRWRRRVNGRTTKHRLKFKRDRRQLNEWNESEW